MVPSLTPLGRINGGWSIWGRAVGTEGVGGGQGGDHPLPRFWPINPMYAHHITTSSPPQIFRLSNGPVPGATQKFSTLASDLYERSCSWRVHYLRMSDVLLVSLIWVEFDWILIESLFLQFSLSPLICFQLDGYLRWQSNGLNWQYNHPCPKQP